MHNDKFSQLISRLRGSGHQRQRRRNRPLLNRRMYFHALSGWEMLEDRRLLVASLAVGDPVVVEGDSGAVDMIFTITRSGDDTLSTVTVGYSTSDDSATAGSDYTAKSGAVTFPAGITSATVTVSVQGDTLFEAAEQFRLNLTGIINVVGPAVTMTGKTDFATGMSPESVAVGDLNRDGRPDLVVGNFFANTVTVLFNNTLVGATTPSYLSVGDFPVDTSPSAVAIADLNGDGNLDLVVANYDSNNVSVLLNQTTPGNIAFATFTAASNFNTALGPTSLAIGDLNGDGRADVAVANFNSNSVSVLLNTTSPNAATPAFSAKTDFTTGSFPDSVAIGDLNGDGRPDLAVANYFSDNVSVLLNTTAPGATTPSLAAKTDFMTGVFPTSVAIGDLNGDGKQDLAVTSRDTASVAVLLNTTAPGATTPTYSAKTDFTTGTTPSSVTIGDLNGDGKPDLAVANSGTNDVSVLLNTTVPGAGTPTYAAKSDFTMGVGSFPRAVSISDLNGDGRPDLAVASALLNSVSVLLNTTILPAASVAASPKTDFAAGDGAVAVAVGDLNGDGKRDLAIANFNSNTVSVLLNTTATGAATPSYAAKSDFTTGNNPISVAIGDLNGDGRPDLAVANFNSNTVSVLLNTTATGAATPSYAAKIDFASGTGPRSVAIGDLNGDGKPDLAVANRDSNTVSVLLNTTATGAATPSYGAKSDFTTGNTPTSVAIGDLNGDGRPDLAVANSGADSVSVLLNTTTPGATTPSYASKSDFTTGTRPIAVAIGDLNSDGRADLAVANDGASSVSVLLNTTAPGASPPTYAAKVDFATGSSPRSVATGDLNGDGRPDLAIANTASNTVSVLLNTTAPGASAPSYGAKTDFGTGISPQSVAIGDLNGDGKPDLATANFAAGTVSVLLNLPAAIGDNQGIGTIVNDDAAPTLSVGDVIQSEGNSGTTNFVFTVTQSAVSTLSTTVAFNTALGTANLDDTAIPAGTLTLPAGSTTGTITVAVTGDTLFETNETFSVNLSGPVNATISPARLATLAPKTDVAAGDGAVAVAVGDLNGDGKPDLAIANYNSGTVSVLLNTTAPGASTPSYAAEANFTTGARPRSVAIGDLNGDGKLDLAIANPVPDSVSVLLNMTALGSSTPTFSSKTDFATGGNPQSVAIGDLNGDGKLDLVIVNSFDDNVSVLLNTTAPGAATPTFSTKTDFATGVNPKSVAIGDLNGDGKLDLAIANSFPDSVSVLLNTTAPGAATASYAPKSDFTTGAGSFSVAIGDLNGDGRPDLAIANSGADSVSVLLNTTAPGATTPSYSTKTDFTTGDNPFSVAIGDLNGDGNLDLATVNRDDGTISVLLNATAPGAAALAYAAKTDFATGSSPRGLALGDLNGDGRPDLVSANFVSDDVSVLLNTTVLPNAPAAVAAKSDFAAGDGAAAVATGDLNGDGKPDLAIANFYSNSVSVLLNTTAPGATTPTYAAKTDFTTGDQPRSVAIADLNGDGRADLVIANAVSDSVSVLLNTTAPGATTPTFLAKTDFTTGLRPFWVAIGDLNGDGRADLAIANANSDNVSVLLNTTAPGAAAVTYAAKTDFTAGDSPISVAIGDLNGDGRADLAIANFLSDSVSVLLNTTSTGAATPAFAAKTDLTTGTRPTSVALGDLNGDGRPDLVISNEVPDSVSVLLNTTAPGATSPTFLARTDFTTGDLPFSVAIGDLNGDGRADLAIANANSNSVSVLLNTTAPGAVTPSYAAKTDFTTGNRPNSVTIGDLNGDGKPDLAIANLSSDNVSVLLNDRATPMPGTGIGIILNDDPVPLLEVGDVSQNEGDAGTTNFVFTVTQSAASGLNTTVVFNTVAGTATAVDATFPSGTLTIAAGTTTATITVAVSGDTQIEANETFSVNLSSAVNATISPVRLATLAPKTDVAAGDGAVAVAVGDLNGDGKPDLAIANYNAGTVSVLLNTTAPGASTPTYAAKTDFATGSGPRSLAIGDLNGDGRPDLAITNSYSTSVSVLLNTTALGSSTPTFSSKSDFATGLVPQSVAIGDLNGDGKLDLAIANRNTNNVSVLLNMTALGSNTPTFSTTTHFTTGVLPQSVAIGDLNGDGQADLAVANFNDGSVSVLLNTTAPGATTPTYAAKTDFPTGVGPIAVAIGDLNGDGRLDLAIANETADSVSVLLNTSAPGATTPSYSTKTDFTTGDRPFSVAIGDLNGDGNPDLATVNRIDGTISVLLSTTAPGVGTPSYAAKTDVATGSSPRGLALGDLNGDGRPDLVSANFNSDNVSVLLNTTVLPPAPATLAAKSDFAAGSTARSVATGDLNGDGRPDLAIANYADNTVSVLLNTTAPGAATPSYAAKTDFAAGTAPRAVAIGDLNGDGRADLAIANLTSNKVSVLFNTTAPGASTPTFAARAEFTTGGLPNSVAIGDVDGDGRPDLTIANFNDSTVSVLLNTTTPGATTPAFAAKSDFGTGTLPFALAIGDVNGDGRPDLAVANFGASTVSVLLNTTAPGAASPSYAAKTDFTAGASTRAVAIGDLNGDGRPDLAVASSGSNSVSVLLNTTAPGAATASFAAKTDFITGTYPTSVAIGDLNGDGRPDLAVSNGDPNSVSLLRNVTALGASSPAFAPKSDFPAGSRPYSVAISDLNGDGRPDLAVSNRNSNNVSVLLNNLAAPTPGTGTGTIINDDVPSLSIADLTQVEGNSGTTNFVFTVTQSASSVVNTTVVINTTLVTANAADATPFGGTLTIAAGATTGTITVAVVGDTAPELDETFTVNLSNPTGATIADAQGNGTIVNDDFPFHNAGKSNDVDGDGIVSGIDLLYVNEALNTVGDQYLPNRLPAPTRFVDTNADNFVSGIDNVLVVAEINSNPTFTLTSEPAPQASTLSSIAPAAPATAPDTSSSAANVAPAETAAETTAETMAAPTALPAAAPATNSGAADSSIAVGLALLSLGSSIPEWTVAAPSPSTSPNQASLLPISSTELDRQHLAVDAAFWDVDLLDDAPSEADAQAESDPQLAEAPEGG